MTVLVLETRKMSFLLFFSNSLHEHRKQENKVYVLTIGIHDITAIIKHHLAKWYGIVGFNVPLDTE